MKQIISAIALLALSACGNPNPIDGKLVGFETQKATIIRVNYPKHFSVSIRTEEGLVFNNTARSKHCTGARNRVKSGQTYDVVLNIYRTPDGAITKKLDSAKLNDILCQ